MNELRDSPVFIAGHPKSGTSLLRSVLDSHPELLTYPEETSFFRRYLPKASGKGLLEKLVISDMTLTHIFEWNQTNPPAHQAGFPDRDYSNIPVAEVRRVVQQLVAEKFRHEGDMLSAVILAYGKVTGKITPTTHLWVEKTPYNEHYTTKIFTWWPAALVLHMVRDPRDNFASYQRKHSNWSPEAFALNWARSTQAGLDNIARYGENRYWMLRYEDLVSDPETILQQLCQFLHIYDDPSLRRPARGGIQWTGNSMFSDQFTAISAAPVGRWQETLTSDEIAPLEVVAAPVMRRLGYTLSGQVSSLDKPARQRLTMHLLALSDPAKSIRAHEMIQTAITILSDPSQLSTVEFPEVTPVKAGGGSSLPRQFYMAIRNISKLFILWLKETFRK